MERKQLIDTINIALQNAMANLHTATIARVERVRETTIDVQPVINREVKGESIRLPLFVKVPPVFMQGGTSYTAHPISVGDYCLLIFTERCFDRWYEGQDERRPAEFRMHDYSDGFAIVGINPLASAITIPGVIAHIGDTYAEGDYEQVGDYTHQGNRTQTGNYDLEGDYTQVGDMDITGDFTQTGNMEITGDFVLNGNMTVNGNIVCSGSIAAGNFTGLGGGAMTSDADIETTGEVKAVDVKAGDISLSSHVHGGVESGGDNTGVPI